MELLSVPKYVYLLPLLTKRGKPAVLDGVRLGPGETVDD